MLQYLLNATIIWAICLWVYELLLKKETWHRWNRLYLLLALVAGLLIPALSFDEHTIQPSGHTISYSIQQLALIKKSITAIPASMMPVQAGAARPGVPGNIIWVLYLAGALIVSFTFISNIIRIASDYRSGMIERKGDYLIIRCRKHVAPYSFFNLIFISQHHDYTAEELDMVLLHEYRHAAMRHSLDILFTSLVLILLWFHPLVYLIRKRLQLVHEYQADEVGRSHYTTYGTFLLEQTMLATGTLTITHSFHSSLKNRILMLTQKSSSKKQLVKYLVAIPMAAVFMIACTRTGNETVPAQKSEIRKGIVTFKGHRFEMSPEKTEKVQFRYAEHPDTVTTMITIAPFPIKMDNEPIMKTGPYEQPVFKNGSLGEYLVSASQSLFDQLADGEYILVINDLVVDRNGELVYHDNPGLLNFSENNEPDKKPIDERLLKAIEYKMNQTLQSNLAFKPGTMNKKPVLSYFYLQGATPSNVTVKNHHAQFITEPDPLTVTFSEIAD